MSETENPTFEHACEIFAYHIGEIMRRDAGTHVRVHFYGNVTGDYTFKIDPDDASHGDLAYVNGECIGNRCAARNDYTKRCAPILEQIARGTYGPTQAAIKESAIRDALRWVAQEAKAVVFQGVRLPTASRLRLALEQLDLAYNRPD